MVKTEVHQFLRSIEPTYRECVYCGERKSMVCLICGYCYECHPAVEEIERKLLAKAPNVISSLDYA